MKTKRVLKKVTIPIVIAVYAFEEDLVSVANDFLRGFLSDALPEEILAIGPATVSALSTKEIRQFSERSPLFDIDFTDEADVTIDDLS